MPLVPWTHVSICEKKCSRNKSDRKLSQEEKYNCGVGKQTIFQYFIKESKKGPGKCTPFRPATNSQQPR